MLAQKEILPFPDQPGVVKRDDFASPGQLKPAVRTALPRDSVAKLRRGVLFGWGWEEETSSCRPQNKARRA